MAIRTTSAAVLVLVGCVLASASADAPGASALAPACAHRPCQHYGRLRPQPMPRANITTRGQTWHRAFADSFEHANSPFGKSCGDRNAFPRTTPKWDAYPYPWHGNPNGGSYCPGLTTAIRNGRMDVRLGRAQVGGSSTYVIDAPLPRVGGHSPFKGQL